jgi:hypothetical protein
MSPMLRLVVFGGAPPAVLAEALHGVAQLVTAGTIPDEEADGVVLFEGPEALDAVRAFRTAGGATPVYGWSPAAVDLERRLAWIREGADDLVGGHVGAARFRARLAQPAAGAPPTAAQRVDEWLDHLPRYLRARDQLWTGVDTDAAERHAACMRLRDQLLDASDPGVALVPAAAVPLRQPILVGGQPMELSLLGADGIAVRGATTRLPVGAAVRVDIRGRRTRARMTANVRWTEASADGTHTLGLLVLACETEARDAVDVLR